MRVLRFLFLACVLAFASVAYAGPRSGSSFGGFRGFRSSPISRSVPGGLSRGLSSGRSSFGGGSSFVFLPSFGWGYGGMGYGGGMGMLGNLVLVGIVCLGAIMVVRSIRRASQRGAPTYRAEYDDYDDASRSMNRCYVYKVQLGIGRSGRGIQKRLEEFATTGDTATELGLAELLRQTALEMMREKDAVRYGLVEPGGPYSLTNGEAKINGAAMAERSRFQVERVRGAGGQVRRSDAAASVGGEALEFLVVTVLVATREPLSSLQKIEDRAGLDAVLAELGSVPASNLLGLEVVWTPADPEDSLTETDLMVTYPEMRSL
ncbi:MAG: DUF1517 domain-containing protein [Deltaproteobacteria bacterium]|nr:DUF1517 domain-containing protein [Deltaproteobacteria bacterium]